jgi:hypothetical protein
MTTKQAKARATKLTVAEYLERAIEMSGKTQRQLTQELGYENPNIITMFKQGKSKLPINKVGAMARSLGLDPANLLRVVMTEYMPEAWAVIEDVVGQRFVTQAQTDFQRLVDEETEGAGADLSDPVLSTAIRAALKQHHKHPTKLNRAKTAE